MTDMSLANVTTGRIPRALRISLYGVDGIGKTTFAACAPNPVFIATEDGTHHVNTARFPAPRAWFDILSALRELHEQQHDFQTVVIDSMDWAEAMCDQHLVEQYNAQNNNPISAITEIPYGGWKALKVGAFTQLIDWCSALVRNRNMHVIFISHANIVRFDDPERETYDRYSLKLYRELAAKIAEWSDFNLFANWDTVVQTSGQGFNERNVGRSHGKRLLFTRRRAAFDAKARFNVPERMELSWEVFWNHYQAALNQ